MNYSDAVPFLRSLNRPRIDLGINLDLSLSPTLFERTLRIKGLYIYGRALTVNSQKLAQIECDVILYNETDPNKIPFPEGWQIFRIRDLQEFAYAALVRVHFPDEGIPYHEQIKL
jgi:hypothetical protein